MTICISVYDNLYSLLGPTGPEGGIDRTEALAKDTFQYAAVCPDIQKYLLRPGKAKQLLVGGVGVLSAAT